jgi:dTDP-4-dehydrorhamnose reductase
VPASLLVTGATGYLGRYVLRAAADAGIEAAGCGSAADVTDPAAVQRLLGPIAAPRAVINLAGINPGQGDPSTMEAVNATGAGVVARACAARGARLVHLSTDVVLAGDPAVAPYPDHSPTAPRNPYARSKAAGEAAVAATHPAAAVVRTSLIYGLESVDRATAGYAGRLAAGGAVQLFGDVWRHPVEAGDLARALVALAVDHPDVAGTLNLAGAEPVTRATFGRRLLEHWQVPGRERVEVTAVSDASVPVDLRLLFERADRLGLRLRGVEEVLAGAG